MTIDLTSINITQWTDDIINTTHTNVSLIIYQGNGSSDADQEDEQQRFQPNSVFFIVTTSIVLSILTICTVIGNILVMAAVLLERNLRTPANYLVLSLALADCLVACLVMPLGMFYEIQGQWSLGILLCEFWISVDVLCCSASILHLLAIAIDRYWAVTNIDYIHHRNAKRIGYMIIIIWSVAAIIALAPNFGWKDPDFKSRINLEKRCLISQDISYQIFATVTTFYMPLIFILVLYWKIYQVARKRIRRKPGDKIAVIISLSAQPNILTSQALAISTIISTNDITLSPQDSNYTDTEMQETRLRLTIQQPQPSSISYSDRSSSSNGTSNHSPPVSDRPILWRSKKSSKQSLNSRCEKKAAKTLAIVTGAFVICWLPFFVMALLLPLCETCKPPQVLLSIFLWLGYVNSLLNCIIYTIFSPDFRTAFKKLLCGRYNHRYRQNGSSSQR